MLGDLPDFEKPPVVEVVLSIQFEPLVNLTNAHLGLLWGEYRERYPKTQSFAPIEPVKEEFGVPSLTQEIKFQLQPAPVLRSWFKNDAEVGLIQIQQDRFVYNWVTGKEGGDYPRYVFVRDEFKKEFKIFQDFLRGEGLGEIIPNQCEVTYINNIYGEGVWADFSEADKLFTVFKPQYSDSFLKNPEHINFALRYIISDAEERPIGRLHILAEPRYRRTDKQLLYVLTLTARGYTPGTGLDGAFTFFEVGHEWIVKGFKSITRPKMHEAWRLKNDS